MGIRDSVINLHHGEIRVHKTVIDGIAAADRSAAAHIVVMDRVTGRRRRNPARPRRGGARRDDGNGAPEGGDGWSEADGP
jgi:hypothetical protein